MYIAALFTITMVWKQPRSSNTDECYVNVVFIHNGILLSHEEE
jgi:hypothetical protein